MPEAETQTKKQRGVYTDGWNSFWHIVFGILASKFPRLIITVFMAYQLFDTEETNVCIDIMEFMYGYAVGIALQIIG
jgi:hypothetical protein